jgi:hypothetical protein
MVIFHFFFSTKKSKTPKDEFDGFKPLYFWSGYLCFKLSNTLRETLCPLCLCGKAFISIFFHHRDTEDTAFHREIIY